MSNWCRKNLIAILTISGVVVGLIVGFSLRSLKLPWPERQIMYIELPGTLFIQILRCVVIPLILPSLIVSVGNMKLQVVGKMGREGILYYMTTTILAALLGLLLVLTIKPGHIGNLEGSAETEKDVLADSTPMDQLLDLIRNFFPPNIVQACLQVIQTRLSFDPTDPVQSYNDTSTWSVEVGFQDGFNVVGLMAFSLAFGVAVSIVGDKAQPVLDFFKALVQIMMLFVKGIVTTAPVAVIFLVAGQILRMEDVHVEFAKLGVYAAIVIGGILVHGALILPFIFFILTRKNPYAYIAKLSTVIATALGTASSLATLPVNMETLENKLNIDPRVVGFLVPIGATVNMDGMAIYGSVAAVFIAQAHNVALSPGQIVVASLSVTLTSVGAAGIPAGGIIAIAVVLESIGVPGSAVGMIIAVDWLVDRFCTALNVMGDSLAAGVVHHLAQDDLKRLDVEPEYKPIIKKPGGGPPSSSHYVDPNVIIHGNMD